MHIVLPNKFILEDDTIQFHRDNFFKLTQATDPSAVIVYFNLLRHYNEELQVCQASYRTLAKETGLTALTVQSKIDKLQENNFIKKVTVIQANSKYHGDSYKILPID